MESRSTITTQINASFPDNNNKFITAEKNRAFMDIINQSKFNLIDDDLLAISVTIDGTTTTLNDYLDQSFGEVKDFLKLEKAAYIVASSNNSANTFSFFNAFGGSGLPDFYSGFTEESTTQTTGTISTSPPITYAKIKKVFTHGDLTAPHVHNVGKQLATSPVGGGDFGSSVDGDDWGLDAKFLPDNKLEVTLTIPTTDGAGDYVGTLFVTSKSPF